LFSPGQSPSEEPLSILKQKEQPSSSRPARRRPTHFITFRANTPGILSGFQRLQEEVCALLPSTTPHWLTSSTLHVTMCLLVLDGPEEVEAAAEILRRFAYLDRNPPLALTFPLKLKHFNGTVLYLSPQPPQRLQELNRGLQEAFWEAGMLHQHSFSPRYHLTLAKVSGVERERVFDGVGELKVGKGLNLGQLYFLLSRCTACVPQNPGLSLCSVAPPHRSSPDSLNANEVQQQCRDLFLLFIRLSVSYFSPILFLFHCMSVRPLL
jgi:2'-5' RNA ligase